MEKELYIKPCCIQNQLPLLLRQHEGRLAVFQSQGDWGVQKLWDAVSHMVSNVAQNAGEVSTTGGKRRMLLVIHVLERHLLDIVADYHRRHWFDHMLLVCHTTTLMPADLQQYLDEYGPDVTLRLGKRAASLSPMWMRWDDQTGQALAIFGPMFTHDSGNPTFAQYTATFHDRLPLDKDGHQPVNERGRQMVSDVMRHWQALGR